MRSIRAPFQWKQRLFIYHFLDVVQEWNLVFSAYVGEIVFAANKKFSAILKGAISRGRKRFIVFAVTNGVRTGKEGE